MISRLLHLVRSLRPAVVALLAACLLGGLVAGCGGDESPGGAGAGGQPPAPSVKTTEVREGSVRATFRYVGRVEPIDSVDIIARVPGFLEQVAFDEGGDVSKGDLLYVIEREPYRAAVNAAKADVANAEATLENARQYLDRLESVQEGGVAAADLDAAKAARREAQARLDAAAARREASEIDLGYTRIRAPIAGRIGRTTITEGNLVGPDSGVLTTIVRMDPIYVTFSASERDVTNARQEAVREGRTDLPIFVPRLELANGTEYAQPGTIDFLDNRVDPATGTLTVRAIFPNPDGLLVPRQFVTVTAERQDPRPALLVPQKAVLQRQEGHAVLVVSADGTVESRTIELGGREGESYIVASGLDGGEQIVVEGVQKARPGSVVEASPLEPADGPADGPADDGPAGEVG